MIMVYVCYVGMEKGLVSLSAFILTLRSHLFKNNFVMFGNIICACCIVLVFPHTLSEDTHCLMTNEAPRAMCCKALDATYKR